MLRSPFARNHSQRARPCSCFTSPAIHFKVTEAEQPDDLKRLRGDLRARGLFYVFTPRERLFTRSGGFSKTNVLA
jgi:hypothetical protein